MLPLLAGFLAGASGLTALTAAGIGAGVGLLTNKDDPLMGAVSGGLGGLGGANLGTAIGSMGATSTPAATAMVNPAVSSVSPGTGASMFTNEAASALSAPTTLSSSLPSMGTQQFLEPATAALTPSTAVDNIGGGIRSLTSEGGWDRFKTALGGAEGPVSNMKAGLALGMPAVSVASSLGAFDQPQPATAPFVEEEDKYTRDGGLFLYGPKSLNSGLKLYNVGGMVDTQNYPARYTNPETENYHYGLGRLSSLAAGQAQANAEANRFAEGGVPTLQDGGFVVPADVVFYMGGHDTAEGQARLAEKYGAMPIRGPGNGLDDSIDTTIEGREPAKIADGEAYIPREVVAKHGGPEKFYKMMDKVRKQATGTTRQAKRATV